jgi:ribosomal protein S24E
MELNITNKAEQKLLARTEINGHINFSGNKTPSNDQVKEAVAKNLGKDSKLIVIKHIYTDFGKASANFICFVYDSENKLKELEEKRKKQKKEETKKE